MLKLLIADDERIIRETISTIIDWQAQDIEVVGLCRNGIEAYDMILDETPDIVLTDIRMPGMDGLDLIQRVSQMNLGIQFIILSGYGEFDYAQRAMQYGVRHYLLKPCNETQILDCVQKCRLDHEKAVQTLSLQHQQHELYREMFHSVISCIMNDCLSGTESSDELAMRYGTFIDFRFTSYRLYYVYFLEFDRLTDYLRRLHSFLDDTLPQTVICEMYVTNTLLLFLPNPGNDIACLQQFLEDNKHFGGKVTLESEEVFYSSLSSLLSVVVGKLQRFGMIYFIHKGQITKIRNYNGVLARMNECFRKLQAGDTAQLENVSEILNGISEPDFLRQLASRFFLKMTASSSNLSTIELANWLLQLDREENSEQLRAMILQRSEEYAQQSAQSSQLSPMVRQIHSYIQEHLGDSSLTLKQIAENVLFMNVDYVSKKFYKETGQKFSQYLTDTRIKTAQEYLAQNPTEPIKNIAEQVGCGNNPQYFSQLFKKQTGITPTEYIASLQKEN